MSTNVVWIGGRLCDADEARVSPFDHGLLTGDGVFETLRTYGSEPFAITRHLERLATSAAGLDLVAPPALVIADAIREVIAANDLVDCRVRVTVTAGEAPLGSSRGAGGPLIVVAASEMTPPADWIDVVTAPWPRNERGALAGLKTTSYAENVIALAYAKARGASEAIFPNTIGNLCEGTGTNVFIVSGGQILTPPLSAGCLAGVTRALVVEQCGAVEEDLPLSSMHEADEVFITGTTRDVQAVRQIDGQEGAVVPGKLTREAAGAYAALVARDLDP